MTQAEASTLEEVIYATRLHERALAASKQHADIVEGLAISATKLERLLRTRQERRMR